MPGVLDKKCGRGLAPDEGVSVTYLLTDPALSGASPLPHLGLHPSGRSESAFALALAALEPTRVVPGVLGKKCGRGLAPDEGVSVTYLLTDPAPSGASPLPHLDLHPSGRPESVFALSFAALEPTGVVPGVLGKKCGRGLAPDEGVSAT